jgi:hypothetical protein
VDKLKKKAAELLPLAIVTEAAVTTKDERHKYKLGRIYLPGFVKSFEYTSASFGLPPPRGALSLVLADPLDGCEPQTAAEGAPTSFVCCELALNNVMVCMLWMFVVFNGNYVLLQQEKCLLSLVDCVLFCRNLCLPDYQKLLSLLL